MSRKNRKSTVTASVSPQPDIVILTKEQIAARLQVPPAWVYEKTRRRCINPIPVMKIGRYLRFDWAVVVDWLRRSSTNGRAV